MGTDRHPDASRHLDAAKSAASSAADNSGRAFSEVGKAAQAYVSDTGHRVPSDNDKPTIEEQYDGVKQQASGRVEEGQSQAEGYLRNLRLSADEHAQRTKEVAAARIQQGQRSTEDALRSFSGTVSSQVQAAQEAASSAAASATDQLVDVTDSAVSSLDKGIRTATNIVKGATSTSLAVADDVAVQARVSPIFATATAPLQHSACWLTDAAVQTYYDIGVAHYRVAEDHFFSSLTGMTDPFACSSLLHTVAGL